MSDFPPSHPVEFLIEEFCWNQYKAQMLIGDRVTEEKAIELEKATGWGRHMWLGIQEQYDKEMRKDD